MATLGAKLGTVTSGQVEIVLVRRPEVSQQHGFVHAGAVNAIADSVVGCAAVGMMPTAHCSPVKVCVFETMLSTSLEI